VASTDELRIWRLSDGRAGHDSQSLGLCDALARATSCRVRELAVGAGLARLWPRPPAAERPDLILGAGHRLHAAMLALRRAHGGRAVIMMRPSLPLAWFDLCLVPAHDAPPARANVIATAGALNRVRPGATAAGTALVLLGGPSRHFDWDAGAMLEQLHLIVEAGRYARGTVTDSRRTPEPTRRALRALAGGRWHYAPHDRCAPGWLAGALAAAEDAWVSRDSVSMIYEALSAGCRLGLLEVPARREGRLWRAGEALLAGGDATSLAAWQAAGSLQPSPRAWAEADRCAAEILARWFPGRAAGR